MIHNVSTINQYVVSDLYLDTVRKERLSFQRSNDCDNFGSS